MTTNATSIETHSFTATGFDALLESPAWKRFDGWMSTQLHQLETTWQSASSPKAWRESVRQSRRTFNR